MLNNLLSLLGLSKKKVPVPVLETPPAVQVSRKKQKSIQQEEVYNKSEQKVKECLKYIPDNVHRKLIKQFLDQKQFEFSEDKRLKWKKAYHFVYNNLEEFNQFLILTNSNHVKIQHSSKS